MMQLDLLNLDRAEVLLMELQRGNDEIAITTQRVILRIAQCKYDRTPLQNTAVQRCFDFISDSFDKAGRMLAPLMKHLIAGGAC